MSVRSLKSRLAKLEAAARSAGGGDYREHWLRIWGAHLDRLDLFRRHVPRTHRTRVAALLGDIEDEICRVGAFVPHPDLRGLKRWAWQWIVWSADHPFNLPAWPTPFPAAFLDLLLDNPAADFGTLRCPACQVFVPSAPAVWEPATVRPRPLSDSCPCCRVAFTPEQLHRWRSLAG